MTKYLTFILIILLSTTTGYSQTSTTENNLTSTDTKFIWVTLGFGLKESGGILGHVQTTVERNLNSLSIDVAGGSNKGSLLGDLYYGRLIRGENNMFRIAGGIGFLDLISTRIRYIALGGQVEAIMKAGPVGLSLILSGTYTSAYSYGALTVNINLGSMF